MAFMDIVGKIKAPEIKAVFLQKSLLELEGAGFDFGVRFFAFIFWNFM
tara:strand:+ start:71083 stop:71226 length:144 start_codon:yes stop_codon:yes gene_type:complete